MVIGNFQGMFAEIRSDFSRNLRVIVCDAVGSCEANNDVARLTLKFTSNTYFLPVERAISCSAAAERMSQLSSKPYSRQ